MSTLLTRPITIAVDAMGGDRGPGEVVNGVVQAALAREGAVQFLLVGDKALIEPELAKHKGDSNIRIHHASQIITMEDKPREVYRRKPDASVVVSARLVKEGAADAFVSIGNTGAAMAASVFLLRPIAGVDRPAIAAQLPSRSGKTVVLLDAGANVDCVPSQLLEFAIMGLCYARQVLGVQNPTLGLLSNGEEASKGDERTRQTHGLLKERLTEFTGNVEGRGVFEGVADVVVCDGFDGNIVLKTAEGVAEMVMGLLKEEINRKPWLKPAALLLRSSMMRVRGRIDYREMGGAPLLGVNGVAIVGHGRSDARAIVNALKVAERSVLNGLVKEIEKSILVTLSNRDLDAKPEPGIAHVA